MRSPLVSVICLCHNHESFVEEAILSVIKQSYTPIELIVVDDASTDNSVIIIRNIISEYPEITFIGLSENIGNCKAFNLGLRKSTGKYIIDFATDDIMVADRIEKQILFFEKLENNVGVIFTDAVYINSKGDFQRNHFDYLLRNKLIIKVPQGDVYRDVLATYFIPGPTMMVRREVFDMLEGYDETLSYEDFDFWVRSSRHFEYQFLDERLTKIRKTVKSMSTGWYKKGDKQLYSTYLVCCNAIKLNKDKGDQKAILTRVRYEMRQSILSRNNKEASLFFDLIKRLNSITTLDRILHSINVLRLPLRGLLEIYHKVRYR